ncbi:hypothetical protein E1301_Tti023474 [Triplophysa tibetana]|uniref:Complexin-3 n=1 Tax=Triplophysa tibetana TaxID=1572043 RepID=A0A5A9MXT2_9TELE|nr:hypothetical protein E1301_Tti023474 [Triplophysa tibetana]
MQSGLKKSLLTPIKTLTYCVTGEKTQDNRTKHKSRLGSKVKSGLTRLQNTHPMRSYQAELERERKVREALTAQKNAERAAMRTHFRRKYHLSKNVKDSGRVRSGGGKVALPRDLAQMVYPEAPVKDETFGLLGAFQGLSFSAGIYTSNRQTKTSSAVNTEPCRVM